MTPRPRQSRPTTAAHPGPTGRDTNTSRPQAGPARQVARLAEPSSRSRAITVTPELPDEDRSPDVGFVNEMLVAPILARMSSGSTEGLDPDKASRRIVELIYNGIQAS
jgi:hypothetical protein